MGLKREKPCDNIRFDSSIASVHSQPPSQSPITGHNIKLICHYQGLLRVVWDMRIESAHFQLRVQYVSHITIRGYDMYIVYATLCFVREIQTEYKPRLRLGLHDGFVFPGQNKEWHVLYL